jgi:hypothetical protein
VISVLRLWGDTKQVQVIRAVKMINVITVISTLYFCGGINQLAQVIRVVRFIDVIRAVSVPRFCGGIIPLAQVIRFVRFVNVLTRTVILWPHYSAGPGAVWQSGLQNGENSVRVSN